MDFNKETMHHYRAKMIPIDKLKKKVLLNTKYLKEKNTWYKLDGEPQYFKVRNDLRVFTELFFHEFAHQVMDLQTLEYRIASVRTIDPVVRSFNEKTELGLLSRSFQDLKKNHYLANEVMNPEISSFVTYSSGYSLESLLKYFEQVLVSEDYIKVRLFLIRLFIADGFTYQLDRNPNNIAFQIPKINGISYKNRLRIEKILELPGKEKYLTLENGTYKLKDFSPNIVFDSERSMGIDHKNGLKFNKDFCWSPNFPYNEELFFENGEIAQDVSIAKYDGYDPNLLSLYLQYQSICEPYFDRLANDDEYRKILETFTNKSSQVILSNDEIEYFNNVLKERQQVLKRILTL